VNVPRIGIVGAGGDIGRRLVAALRRPNSAVHGPVHLVLAGRDPRSIPVPPALDGTAATVLTTQGLDARDLSALARFAAPLDAVVSAIGPSHDHALRAASTVTASGAHYVDVGGPADAQDLDEVGVCSAPRGDRTALLYAGALPGASGILPRALLRTELPDGTPPPRTLEVVAGGRGAFTRAGAEDYLEGLAHGDVEPLAAWRDGHRVSGVVAREDDVEREEFPEPVSLFPFLDADGIALARQYDLDEATWYSAMAGDGIADLLRLAAGMGVTEGARRLRDATTALAAGTRSYVVLAACNEHRRMLLRAPGEAALAAEVATAAVAQTLAGQVATGIAPAAAALDPERALADMTGPGSTCTVTTIDDPSEPTMQEGTL
jgi:hypothetical protein